MYFITNEENFKFFNETCNSFRYLFCCLTNQFVVFKIIPRKIRFNSRRIWGGIWFIY